MFLPFPFSAKSGLNINWLFPIGRIQWGRDGGGDSLSFKWGGVRIAPWWILRQEHGKLRYEKIFSYLAHKKRAKCLLGVESGYSYWGNIFLPLIKSEERPCPSPSDLITKAKLRIRANTGRFLWVMSKYTCLLPGLYLPIFFYSKYCAVLKE